MLGSKGTFHIERLVRRLAHSHRWPVRAVQLAVFLFAGISAFLLRFDFDLRPSYRPHLRTALLIWVLTKIPVFHALGLDRGWWRYTSVPDILRLGVANSIGAILSCLGIILLAPPGFPRSIYVIDFVLCATMTAAVRIAVRVGFETSRQAKGSTKRRTLIYGAGAAGVTLLREIRQNPALAYEIVGFIDDLPAKAGRMVQRVKVFGPGPLLKTFVVSQRSNWSSSPRPAPPAWK
jgi:FlaA1/EpsC-like NDP-sugar epimerase